MPPSVQDVWCITAHAAYARNVTERTSYVFLSLRPGVTAWWCRPKGALRGVMK